MTVTLREYFDAACVLHETIRQIKSAGFLLNPDGYTAPAMELIGNTELKDIDAGYADAERALDEACKFSNLINGCCEELLKTLPKAKACPTCGKSFRASKTRDKDLREYIAGLHGATLDVASEVLDPHERSSGSDESRVGNWWLFEGFPLNCDVVKVNSLDITASGEYAEQSCYTTFSVGREHRRNCAWGSLLHEDLE